VKAYQLLSFHPYTLEPPNTSHQTDHIGHMSPPLHSTNVLVSSHITHTLDRELDWIHPIQTITNTTTEYAHLHGVQTSHRSIKRIITVPNLATQYSELNHYVDFHDLDKSALFVDRMYVRSVFRLFLINQRAS